MYDLGVFRPVYHRGLVHRLLPSQWKVSHLPAFIINLIISSGQQLRMSVGGMHCISQQGKGIYVIKPVVPSRNLQDEDPVWQLLPRLSPPDSPVVTTKLGGHFQAVVRKYNSVTSHRGVTSEQVHVMPIHGHHQVPEGPLISNSAYSSFFFSHIFDLIPGRKIQVITTTILGFHECFKATMKIKTFKSSLGRAFP